MRLIDMPTKGAYGNVTPTAPTATSAAPRRWSPSASRKGRAFRGERRNLDLALREPTRPGRHRHALLAAVEPRRAPRLRGYGGDRFIDFNRALIGAELRARVYERKLFGVKAQLELAPFVETGQVFRHLDDSPFDDLHWVGGLGFRGLVRPQVVAFVDVGYGDEGSSIFTGIDYPF
jgi:hypothetical protein